MGKVITLWGIDELERVAEEAVKHAWETKRPEDYEIADRLYALWLRRRRRSGPSAQGAVAAASHGSRRPIPMRGWSPRTPRS